MGEQPLTAKSLTEASSGPRTSAMRYLLSPPALVFLVSSLLLLATHGVFHQYHPEKTWGDFWSLWGTPLHVTYTILLAILVSVFPSRFENRMERLRKELEEKLKYLEDRIQSPISSFMEVVDRAEFLLAQLGNRPNTEFMLVSASPILGLELDDAKREHWRSLLASRIEVNDESCKTSIVCLNPYGTATSTQSELGEFCKVLAESLSRREPAVDYETLFNRGRKGTEKFQTEYSKRPNFKLRFSGDPPFQVIIARDEKGNRRSILYLSSTGTLRRGLPPSGFYTEESRMGDVLQNVFSYISASAVDAPEDPRTSKQRDRDFDLQLDSEKRPRDFELDYPNIAPGFKLLVKKGVFPPDIALAAGDFEAAIAQAVNLVWADVPEKDRIGIDVGTGTGVLALLLAKHCPLVIASDVGESEIENAQQNYERYKVVVNSGTKMKFVHTSLLERIDQFEAGKFPLIVFNHPYYPSPSNVFNVGGPKAGLASIESFLNQAKSLVAGGGGVIMPSADIAERHDPVKVATRLGYDAKLIGPKREHPSYGEHYIYLFRLLGDQRRDQRSRA